MQGLLGCKVNLWLVPIRMSYTGDLQEYYCKNTATLQEPVEGRLRLPGDPECLVSTFLVADEGRERVDHRLLGELEYSERPKIV